MQLNEKAMTADIRHQRIKALHRIELFCTEEALTQGRHAKVDEPREGAAAEAAALDCCHFAALVFAHVKFLWATNVRGFCYGHNFRRTSIASARPSGQLAVKRLGS